MPTQIHTHFQLPHHELLGHMVPPGLGKDEGMAYIMLQTPALGLGEEVKGGGGYLGPFWS